MGHTTSRAVWVALERVFSSQSRAMIMQLRSQLKTTRKRANAMVYYLFDMKNIDDNLSSTGQPVLDDDLILYDLSALGL